MQYVPSAIAKGSIPSAGMITLPCTTSSTSGREVTSNHRSSRNKWGRHWRRESKNLSLATICTDIVLVSSELSTLRGDSLEILLSWSISIANLKKESLFADRLAMEFSDDLLTDLTRLKSAKYCYYQVIQEGYW
jgi:hypothetical protein